ncbi:TetR/AcrR family transcriptional regulator [Nitratireductor pacificus]|uniref:TetR family transcriptional regulator n=1 Tax=Nitratireductor pacificus pht-3B TaxID=391937 RepID=K2MMR4_9HYPH|nr:TetR/AcrR family transcriptional regulator [Nitratireductor pacificus]EKF18537.1 TetR family transcriptional regulator [Nitratireductor pacificus pht-3B]
MSIASKQRPRTKPAEERREELMNAAEVLFLEKGIGSTTVGEITAGADVAKGTFYLHFSSKEDIHAALGERFVRAFVADLEAALARASKAGWNEKLAVWVKAATARFLDNGSLVNMLFHTHPRPPDDGPNPIAGNLKALLEAGRDAGAWSLDDPEFTAVFLFGGLHGIVDEVLLGKKRASRARLTQRLQRHFQWSVGLPEA